MILWAWISKLFLITSGPQKLLQTTKILMVLWDQLPIDYKAEYTPGRGPYWPSHWLDFSASRGFFAGLVFSGISFPPTCFLTETHHLTRVWGPPAGLSWDRVFHSDRLCLPNLPSPLNSMSGSLSLEKLLELQATSILCTCAQCYLRAAHHHCHIQFSPSTIASCPWKSLPTPCILFRSSAQSPALLRPKLATSFGESHTRPSTFTGVAARTLCSHSDIRRKMSGFLESHRKAVGATQGAPCGDHTWPSYVACSRSHQG